jgi:hypothetical protein
LSAIGENKKAQNRRMTAALLCKTPHRNTWEIEITSKSVEQKNAVIPLLEITAFFLLNSMYVLPLLCGEFPIIPIKNALYKNRLLLSVVCIPVICSVKPYSRVQISHSGANLFLTNAMNRNHVEKILITRRQPPYLPSLSLCSFRFF